MEPVKSVSAEPGKRREIPQPPLWMKQVVFERFASLGVRAASFPAEKAMVLTAGGLWAVCAPSRGIGQSAMTFFRGASATMKLGSARDALIYLSVREARGHVEGEWPKRLAECLPGVAIETVTAPLSMLALQRQLGQPFELPKLARYLKPTSNGMLCVAIKSGAFWGAQAISSAVVGNGKDEGLVATLARGALAGAAATPIAYSATALRTQCFKLQSEGGKELGVGSMLMQLTKKEWLKQTARGMLPALVRFGLAGALAAYCTSE